MLDAGPGALATAADKVRGPYPSAIDHILADPSPLPTYMRELDMPASLQEQLVSQIQRLRDLR